MNSDIGLALPLNRPQYVPAPEVLVSSLVWGTGDWSYPDEETHGSRFMGSGASKAGICTTAPTSLEQRLAFAGELRSHGLQTEAPDETLVQAVLNGVTGVQARKATSVPVSPMTTHLALAQNLRGVLGAKNPPDMGGILESMFILGAEDPAPDDVIPTMASGWLRAAERRLEQDPVLRAADAAIADAMGLIRTSQSSQRADDDSHRRWRGRLRETPFGWLHDCWTKLTSPAWVEALPPRVWTDWCTTLLRMAIAFGYLFESRWYEAVGRSILSGEEVPDSTLNSSMPLMVWPGARLPVSSRNIKPEMRRVVANGVLTRAALLQHFGRSDFDQIDLREAVEEGRRDSALKQSVREALSGRSWPGACKNMNETILYSLQQRDVSSETDYYGLLRRHGNRYSVVQPGTEWVAVMASLACDGPGGETHLGQVLAMLSQLGLRPELMELVKALEAAGLAQGSADADHGVRVRSAY